MVKREELFKERETQEYLAHVHDERVESLGDWHDRIETARELVRGNISYTNPDGVTVGGELQITNLADQVPRDTARLVSEVEPNYRAPIKAKGDKADLNAELRGAIARNYFEQNRFDITRPYLSLDLDLSGVAIVCAWIDPTLGVPRFERVDPLFAYPDTYNGRLIDLLVIQTMKLRTVRMIFPYEDFGDTFDRMQESDDVTIMDYYGPKYIAKAVGRTGTDGTRMDPGKVYIVDYDEHNLDRVPVGFVSLPSPTGEFHGTLDQIAGPMVTKNRIVNLITEYAHEGIYAPWEERGILNWNEDPGPDTKYHHNSNLEGETFMRRLAPAQFNGELFGLLQFLEAEQRGQMGYPASRQGEVSQSIASSSFVTSTQGQLNSIVRERQRLLTLLQEDLTAIAFQLDQSETLNFEKPLPTLIGGRNTYTPSEDIGDNYEIRIEYGAGAGLDRLNTDQRLINFYTVGVLSGETMLEQSDFIPDARGEMERRENEEISRLLLQKWLSDPGVTADIIGMVIKLKKQRSITLAEAWAEIQSQLAEQQAAQEQAAAEATEPAAGVAPPAEGGEAAPQPTPEFAKQPLGQVFL